jgi:hypothetical protein
VTTAALRQQPTPERFFNAINAYELILLYSWTGILRRMSAPPSSFCLRRGYVNVTGSELAEQEIGINRLVVAYR